MVRGERGFTLIELVVVIAVVGLLIWVALPRSFTADVKLHAAARQLQWDIRYAQELAMVKGRRHQIRFFSATHPSPTNRYEIVTSTGNPVKNPLTGQSAYVVDFTSGPFSGVWLDTTTAVTFDARGRPDAGYTITLSGGRKGITVTAETGRVAL